MPKAKRRYWKRDKSHIHQVGDGRGYRSVYVNGGYIPRAVYANERKGVVISHRFPRRFNRKTGEFQRRHHRGKVTIKWLTKSPPP